MKKLTIILLVLLGQQGFSQINSPNGNNIFYYNGAADVTFRFADRGSGGRAFVHAHGNILGLNYGNDFTGGTRIGNNVFFQDDGNSYIYSGNFGIGTSNPTSILELERGNNSNLTFDLNTNSLSRIISKGWNASIEFSTFKISGEQNNYQLNLNTNGNVGIGTSAPDAPLTVYGRSKFYPSMVGASDARSLTVSSALSNHPFVSNNYPVILTTGAGDQPMVLDAARIGIGTTTPNEKLSVNGKIRAHEIKVEAANWPDYVFDQDYKILGLRELDAYIKQHKHLPDVPSSKEAELNGIELGEMNKLLLKKVEELTLHLIEKEKGFQQLLERVKALEEKSKN